MKVSIIIPHYNRSALLLETLQSILNQTWQQWECIVVDDGSDTNEYSTVNSYKSLDSRIRIVDRPSDKAKGANACRNHGALLSSGEYLIFLDSDDLLHPECLQQRLEASKNHSFPDLLIFNMQRFVKQPGDNDKVANNHHVVTEPDRILNLFLMFKLPWPITSAFWKGSFFKTVLFDENLGRFQDVDVHIRALLQKPNLAMYPYEKPDCFYRISTFHNGISAEKMKKVVSDGMYLVEKYERILPVSKKRFATGLLLFLPFQYHKIVDVRKQVDFYKIYVRLAGRPLNNVYGALTIIASHRFLDIIPFIRAIRVRLFYFARKKFTI